MAKALINGKMVGAETIVTDLRRHGDTIRAKLRAELQASAQQLAATAAGLAPRKTGALAASIKSAGWETETQLLASVGTDIKHGTAFYGRFLESGWTPNPKKKIVNLTVPGALNQYVVMDRAEWTRNPRKAKDWRDYARKHGGRRIVSHPFLKPALAQLRGRIRERMLAVVRGEG